MNRPLTHRCVMPLLVAILFTAQCASQSARPAAPEVTLTQLSSVPDLRVASASGVPVDYQLEIRNVLEQPVTLVAVEVESVGQSGAYGMRRVRHPFDLVIPARSSETVEFRAWVQPLQRDMRGDVDGPVLLRGTARFESAAGGMRRNFVSRSQ